VVVSYCLHFVDWRHRRRALRLRRRWFRQLIDRNYNNSPELDGIRERYEPSGLNNALALAPALALALNFAHAGRH
jgi:hypothetical protein